MSQENVERVRFGHDAIRNGDVNGFLTIVSPNIEIRSLIVEPDTQTPFLGHDGVRRWFAALTETFNDFGSELTDVRALGDHGAIAKLRAFGTVEGVEVDQTMWQAIEFRDELLYRLTFCRSADEALDFVGVSE